MTLLLDSHIDVLRTHGYRVLAPFVPGPRVFLDRVDPHVPTVKVAAIIDVETTGLEYCEIVQLAILRVHYDGRGLVSCGTPWSAFNQPSQPIPEAATAVHGITDAMVKGHRITEDDVRMQLHGTSVLVAHNAAFDAPVFVRAFPTLPRYPWACSLVDVPWTAHYESARLGALLQDHTQQYFHGHDAGLDAAATAEILGTPFADGTSPWTVMLDPARQPRVRLFAHGAPFHVKDGLKRRGYRWDPTGKVWWIDALEADAPAEKDWLDTMCVPQTKRITPATRFL